MTRAGYLRAVMRWVSAAVTVMGLSAPMQAVAAGTGEPQAGAASKVEASAAQIAGQTVAQTVAQIKAFAPALASGPNGPIPAIVVDQFGYRPDSRKIAIIRDPQTGYDAVARYAPGAAFAVVDVATGAIVASGSPTPWNGGTTDPVSGDRAWWFDFSDLTRPGRYVVADTQNRIRSFEFNIAETVYRPVMVRAVKMFFYQRAGAQKSAAHAGAAWADAASHLGPGQDTATAPWPGAFGSAGQKLPPARDLSGGWYDAGDYNKYTTWLARNVITLLTAYEEHPNAFSDDTGIPESGNAVPDLLDEVKWALDWLARMQNTDGGVLCVQNLATGTPPSRALGRSHYGPATTSATLMAAAAFARAARTYGALDQPAMKAYGAQLATRARDAWRWTNENPNVLYFNNDETRQPGSRGLAHGQQELSEPARVLAKLEAALSLFELDGDPALRRAVEAQAEKMLPRSEPTLWEIDTHEVLLRVARMNGASPPVAVKIRSWFLGSIASQAGRFEAELQRNDPYRAPIQQYTWGSNKAKSMQARLFQLAALHTTDVAVRKAALDAAQGYLNYLHGTNPLGLVYLTNMGQEGATHSANTMFHAWFAKGTPWEKVADGRPGPPPGFLVGGPNPAFRLDGCCTNAQSSAAPACGDLRAAMICRQTFRPPIGQPPAKSYLQFNDTWPANAWEITEPSTVYQAHYIRLLAAYVR